MPRIAPPPFGSAIAGGVDVAAVDGPFAVPFAAAGALDAAGLSGAVTCGEALVLALSLRNEITSTWMGGSRLLEDVSVLLTVAWQPLLGFLRLSSNVKLLAEVNPW